MQKRKQLGEAIRVPRWSVGEKSQFQILWVELGRVSVTDRACQCVAQSGHAQPRWCLASPLHPSSLSAKTTSFSRYVRISVLEFVCGALF